MSCLPIVIGGFILNTSSKPIPTITCMLFSLSTTYLESMSSLKWTPKYSPRPITFVMYGFKFYSSFLMNSPITRLFSTNPFFYSSESTASATKHAAELPPKVLKYVLGKKRSSYYLKIHAPIGYPLAIGLPQVMISGTIPDFCQAQKVSPVRPKPV